VERDDSVYTNGTGCAIGYFQTVSKFIFVGDRDPSYGDMKVYIDGQYVTQISAYAKEYQRNQVLYVSPTLPWKRHTMDLRQVGGKPFSFHASYVLQNRFLGMVDLESTHHLVTEGEDVKLKLVRHGGDKGVFECVWQTVPGNAIPGVNYEAHVETVVFADQETAKEITVRTYKSGSGLNFYVELLRVGDIVIGFNRTATVSIVSADKQ
jgi:hypothetical protein